TGPSASPARCSSCSVPADQKAEPCASTRRGPRPGTSSPPRRASSRSASPSGPHRRGAAGALWWSREFGDTSRVKPGHVFGERFAIEATAGSGGMGVVYRACDRRTGAPVALKVLHSCSADGGVDAARFDREALLLAELRHPAIVGYVAHG